MADIIEIRGNRLHRNVTTQLEINACTTRCVLTKYCVLMLKMHHGKKLNVQAKNNLAMLCDLECFLGLAYLTPMMQALDYLIKLSRARNYFIGDMVAVGKIYQQDLYSQYVDSMCALTHEHIFTKSMTDLLA